VILVAGGSGRLGTVVVQRLTSRGLPVRVFTRNRNHTLHLDPAHVEVVTGDVRDRAGLGPIMADVDVVVSAIHGLTGPRGVSPATVDRDGNANLIDAAKTVGADFILVSTVGAAAGSSMELFRMKHAAEQYAAASGIAATVVRSTAFAELWIGLLEQTAARSGRPLVFGRGDNRINFVSVNDVAALVERAVTDLTTRGEVLEIGGPDNLTFTELASIVQNEAGRTSGPRHVPPAMLHLVAATVGRVKPDVGRQARAALAMDRLDLTFHATSIRSRYPDLPMTSVSQLLDARRALC
jgi:NADH dehydrogenase